MKYVTSYKQTMTYSCGACVAMEVLNAMDKLDEEYNVELEKKLYGELAGDGIGTNPSSLLRFFRKLGLKAELHQHIGWWTKINLKLTVALMKKFNITKNLVNRQNLAMFTDVLGKRNLAAAMGLPEVVTRHIEDGINNIDLVNEIKAQLAASRYIIAMIPAMTSILDLSHHWLVIDGVSVDNEGKESFTIACSGMGRYEVSVEKIKKFMTSPAVGVLYVSVEAA